MNTHTLYQKMGVIMVTLGTMVSGCKPIENHTQSACMKILSGGDLAHAELWKQYIQERFLVERPKIGQLILELEALESDPHFGKRVKDISEKYKVDPPKGTQDINTWALHQLQDNLSEVLFMIFDDASIAPEAREYILQKVTQKCPQLI